MGGFLYLILFFMSNALDFCYFEGKICKTKDANVNIQTHALQYGTGCFEGIRAYKHKKKFFLLKCNEHYKRLAVSAKILGMKLPMSPEEATEITIDLIKKNKPDTGIYIRPILYKSSLELGPKFCDIDEDFAIYMISLGDYLDTKKGLNVMVSSWRRVSDNAIPSRAKVTGSYVNSALARTEAIKNGYDEAIFLNEDGKVAEGSAENIFIIRNKKLITTDSTSNILEGITRKSIIDIARNIELDFEMRTISRTELYAAEEIFFTGTGAQVAPVTFVDGRKIGDGKMGKITSKIQKIFFDACVGKIGAYEDWTLEI